MKRTILLCLLLFLPCLSFADPAPPVMTYETDGLSVSISWDEVSGATGYKLYYAPYPYTGPETIGHVDVAELTSKSFYLWEGAAYHVAVTAYDVSGESGYSNIEYFIMGPPTPEWVDDDNDGFTEVDGDCDDTDVLISPGVTETCGDGVDQDCSGEDLTCPFLHTPPELTYVLSGINVTISWTEVPGATGYTLFYTPYSDTGPETFESMGMGNATSFNIDLWEGAT